MLSVLFRPASRDELTIRPTTTGPARVVGPEPRRDAPQIWGPALATLALRGPAPEAPASSREYQPEIIVGPSRRSLGVPDPVHTSFRQMAATYYAAWWYGFDHRPIPLIEPVMYQPSYPNIDMGDNTQVFPSSDY